MWRGGEERVNFIASGRPDVLFALIPDVPAELETRYRLLVRGQPLGLDQSFILRPSITDTPRETSALKCLISLDAPDLKAPVREVDDRAPEAGIQRHYEISVYPMRGDELLFDEAPYVSGLATFQWLSVNDEANEQASALAPIISGRARSTPLTTPLGEQRLLVRAITERGVRCREIFETQSL